MTDNNTKIKLDSGRKGFAEAYTKLTNIPAKVKDDLREELGWSVATFYNKMNGITPIWEFEAEKIAAEFAKIGLDPWTGETLFFK